MSQRAPLKTRRKDERGSVLIFVVGVLVLLALSATAFLATARVDRVTTKQNEYNTQIDLLLEGCRQLAIARILNDQSIPFDDKSGDNGIRTTVSGDSTKGSYFADSFASDKWIASRVPQRTNSGGLATAAGTVNWRSISRGVTEGLFQSPTGQTYDATALNTTLYYEPINLGSYPGLRVRRNNGGTMEVQGEFIAADADGDGIADSGLVRLPIAKLNGLTYYAAFRIVDHGSAVNISTALSRDEDYASDQTTALPTSGYDARPIGFFPTGVGLYEMLRGGSTERDRLSAFRFGAAGATPPAQTDISAGSTIRDYRSIGDKYYHDLIRRRNDPASSNLKTFSLADQMALSARFMLRDNSMRSDAEVRLAESLYNVLPHATSGENTQRSTPFDVGQIDLWYNSFFNYTSETAATNTFFSRRPLVTAMSDQGLYVRGASMDALINSSGTPRNEQILSFKDTSLSQPGTEHMPYYGFTLYNSLYEPVSPLPSRTSVNTAPFGELWRAYWNVMCNPAAPALPENNAPQLSRSWVQQNGAVPAAVVWDATSQMLLRAGQAAVNVLDARDPDDDITVKTVQLSTAAGVRYNASVFGNERQAFFTRAVIAVDGSHGATYVAVEIHNPHSSPLVLQNWQLGYVDRSVVPYKVMQIGALNTTIPANGFLVLTDGPQPPSVQVATGPNVATLSFPNLQPAKLGRGASAYIKPYREFILLRPRRADGVLSTANDLNTGGTLENLIAESITTGPQPEINNFVPLDQMPMNVDETDTNPAPNGTVYVLHRPTTIAQSPVPPAVPTIRPWEFVYQDPRPNDPDNASTAPDAADHPFSWNKLSATGAITLGAYNNTPATAPVPVIPLVRENWPAPTPGNGTLYNYPFGGFARLGDLLQVPYIGAVIIRANAAPGALVDLNSVTVDAYYARDINDLNQANEPVGRPFADPGNTPPDDFSTTYAWASDLFTFFTVLNHPGDEYTRALTRNAYDEDSGAPTPLPLFNLVPTPYAAPTKLTNAGPVSGMVNINTAPFKVLSMLPWIGGASDRLTYNELTGALSLAPDGRNDNEDIARAIVHYRDYELGAQREFHHITDLLKIPALKALATEVGTGVAEADDVDGDLTPVNQGVVDNLRNDVEEKSLLLSRVSNLITTRSDVFTVYIDLQGWRDAGTPNATMVVERRAAMIVDRSAFSPTNSTAAVTRVPAN